jgi:hypothetical protein
MCWYAASQVDLAANLTGDLTAHLATGRAGRVANHRPLADRLHVG